MYIYIQWNNKSTTCGISLNLKRSCCCMILISNFLKAKSVGKQNNNTMCIAFLANLTSSTGNIDLTKYNCLQLVIIQRANVICPMRNFDPCKKWNVQYLFYLTKYFYGNIYVAIYIYIYSYRNVICLFIYIYIYIYITCWVRKLFQIIYYPGA